MMIAAALMHILQQAGVMERLFAITAAVAIPSAIVWIAAATLGRAATLKRLLPASRVNAAPIGGLNISRSALLVITVVGWYLWMVLCNILTATPAGPNYPLYLPLSLLSLLVIAPVWGILNWILSLAPLVAVRDGSNSWKAYSDTVRVVRRHRGEFVSVTTWLGLPRLAAMVIAFMIAVVVLIAIDSIIVGTVALAIITLAYSAFADYLYVVRLAAYAQVARELPIATAATPL